MGIEKETGVGSLRRMIAGRLSKDYLLGADEANDYVSKIVEEVHSERKGKTLGELVDLGYDMAKNLFLEDVERRVS